MEYYLCILDFEATCWEGSVNADEMEIIEFPSVLYKVDETNNQVEFISEFSKYVKPTINPKLSKFCTELTGITQNVVDDKDTINIVYKQHINWLHENVPYDKPLIIATCGAWDLNTQLPREIRNKKLHPHSYYSKFINVKTEFQTCLNGQHPKGMMGMLQFLNITPEGRHHSGIDDTRNIAKIMLKLIQNGHKYDKFKIKFVDYNRRLF